ncbi:MAG: N-acetyl-D-glucosamine ABC transporter, substrate-binding protein [uncultured Thermomicrobiales bacterium]|uniref:sn-glycerol-3-phosphate-binding periplasmic protein UgpB n=1 Tax=uncultured Thermomicrobiales bacterium TaxID=1645740 RepID=A0A6J4V8W8_9BACT|nr:MAG: N-acetyl-D-glucosamine ABC transporter, substrate-binding protein [uncultured Thermomicrobiales bacterium]
MTTTRFSRRQAIGGATAMAAGAALTRTAFPARTSARQATTTIEVWGGVPAENGPQDLIDAFQVAHPDIGVNYTRYVNDDTGNTQLDTALQGGTPIDVYFTYALPRLAQRTGAGAATDLAPYMAQDKAVMDWASTTDGVTTADGVYTSLPTTAELGFILANQRLLEEAGLTLPENWTFDEFQTMAETLSSDSVYGTFAVPDEPRTRLGPNYWYKEDGTSSNFDDPAFRAQLERQRAMIDSGSAFPWSDVLAQDLRAYAQTPFLTEQVALWSTAAFSLRYVNDMEEYPHDFVTTFAPTPTPADVAEPWNLGGLNNWILMNSQARQPDAAWTFIRYWLTDGAAYLLRGGKIPAFPGTSEDAIVEGILGPDRETLYDVEAFRRVLFAPDLRYPTDTETSGISQIAQIWQAETDRFLIGETELDETLTSIKQQADAAIASAG